MNVTLFNPLMKLGNVRKHKLKNSEKDLKRLESMSTDEVLERIQQQMAEVMANAQEVANSAVTTENEALAVAAVIDNKTGGKNLLLITCGYEVSCWTKHGDHGAAQSRL